MGDSPSPEPSTSRAGQHKLGSRALAARWCLYWLAQPGPEQGPAIIVDQGRLLTGVEFTL